MGLEMLGEILDAFGQERDLHLGRSVSESLRRKSVTNLAFFPS
jgi:hypothetical protein